MNETESIDTAIEQVERLYRSVTGRDAPPVSEHPYATIPPERVPEEHVQEQVDRLVETLATFSTGARAAEVEWRPAIALWESKEEILIAVDLPGTARENVHVAVERGVIQIHGNRPLQHGRNGEGRNQGESRNQGEGRNLKYVEHPYGKFRRVIPLPHAARTDQLQANMRDGVLEVRIPKRDPETRDIPVA